LIKIIQKHVAIKIDTKPAENPIAVDSSVHHQSLEAPSIDTKNEEIGKQLVVAWTNKCVSHEFIFIIYFIIYIEKRLLKIVSKPLLLLLAILYML